MHFPPHRPVADATQAVGLFLCFCLIRCRLDRATIAVWGDKKNVCVCVCGLLWGEGIEIIPKDPMRKSSGGPRLRGPGSKTNLGTSPW